MTTSLRKIMKPLMIIVPIIVMLSILLIKVGIDFLYFAFYRLILAGYSAPGYRLSEEYHGDH